MDNSSDRQFAVHSKAIRARVHYKSRRSNGFTLIEALIALIMFGVIMSSLSFAFSTVMKAQTNSETHQVDNGSIRVVFDAMKKDIQAGYASATDPSSVFIGGGTASGSGQNTVSSPGILTLSTTSYRIQADELNSAGSVQGTNSIGSNSVATTPQSGVQLVRYDFDSGSGQLIRSVVAVPNLQLVTAPTPGDPTTILATGVVSVTFQYWDPTQTTWRDTWDYEQSNQTAASTTGTTGTGATGSGAATSGGASASSSSTSSANTNGDTTFPSAVLVTIVKVDSNGRQASYSTIFPIAAGQPYIDPSTQAATTTGTGTGSTTGQ